MKIVQFCSSVSDTLFWRRMLQELTNLGWQAQEMSAMTNEDYRNNTGRFVALRRRWKMYPGFAVKLIRAGRSTRRVAIRVVTTNPFFGPWLASRTSRGSTPTINLLYDLFPDAMEVAGVLGEDSLLSRSMAFLTRSAFKSCEATVFLGGRLRAFAECKYGPARNACVIPVGADGDPFKQHSPVPISDGQPTRFLYCGKMGRMHDTESLANLMSSAAFGRSGHRMQWVFSASGTGYQKLCKILTPLHNDSLRLGKSLDDAAWIDSMRKAHVAVVTMREGAENVVMPSKTYSAMVAGQAVLAICPSNSDLADLVKTHNCGWVVEPGDVESLTATVEQILSHPSLLQEKRENAFREGHRHYDMAAIALRWHQLLRERLCEAESPH